MLSYSRSAIVSLLALSLASGIAFAQQAEDGPPKAGDPKKQGEYEPQVGQPGKDVIWVPTPQTLVDRMLNMAGATRRDFVIDLGSGDGRTVITAAKRGIRALGIEYNPDMVALSKRNAEREGALGLVQFVQGDIFKTDFSRATVLTMYLLPSLNIKLRPTILNMKPGTRVVSHSFDMGEWEPEYAIDNQNEKCTQFCSAYFWIVPARVQGTWRIRQGTLTLDQRYQHVSGTLRTRKQTFKIENGRLRGEEITFVAGDMRYTGTVSGRRMTGTMQPVFKATKQK
ncbi:MAG: class I SAM-dependent methyltransferase [Alphaproteobacteria bacterium]|nr:class I SAM-dependent methyltransferase [Alphaproteobacteria bacterium]